MIAKHIIFTGHVQGVGFRFTVHRIANRYQLTGFVRNLYDGNVEMLAQGSGQDIDNCIQDIKNSFAGYIREALINEIPADPMDSAGSPQEYKDFRITF
jgi:acylphosphatase